MRAYHIQPSSIHGNLIPPPSKSQTQRAILFASLAHGQSDLHNYLYSPDTDAMIQACRQLGANITTHSTHLQITGTHGHPQTPLAPIQTGNSGQVLRFVSAVATLAPGRCLVTGDHSICNNRRMQALITGLSGLGVTCQSLEKPGYAPLTLTGPLRPGRTRLNGQDSQPISALLIATAFLAGPTHIEVDNPGETPWIDVTLDWLKRLNIPYQQTNYRQYFIPGHAHIQGFSYQIPADFSSLAYPLVAALITRSAITLTNIDWHDAQGDKAVIQILQKLGAVIEVDTHRRCIRVKPEGTLRGAQINVNACVDALPILAVVGCYAQGTTQLTHAAVARHKESNRLAAMETELKKMGARITQTQDGLVIHQAPLNGALLNTHDDHRVALSLAVAAMGAKGGTTIQGVDCTDKSYPNFASIMRQSGMKIKESQHDKCD